MILGFDKFPDMPIRPITINRVEVGRAAGQGQDLARLPTVQICCTVAGAHAFGFLPLNTLENVLR